MAIKDVSLISNVIGYGPEPLFYEEVEQCLTISSTGEVCCRRFAYGDGGEDNVMKNEERISISEEAANRILAYIDKFFEEYEPIWATDVGKWHLEALFDDGSSKSTQGPMIGTEPVDGVDLSEMIREEVPIEGLFLFDGNLIF